MKAPFLPLQQDSSRHVSPSLPELPVAQSHRCPWGFSAPQAPSPSPPSPPRLLPEVTSQTNYWLSNPVSGSTSGRSQTKILSLSVKDSSLEGALAVICDTPLLSEGVTEAPEEKLLSRELQLSPPLPQVLGRQPLSPSGPASSQEQGLAGEARVQGERRAEGTHTGLFLGYGSLWAPTADQGAPRRRACGENHRVGVATAGPEGPGFLPGLPRPPPYFETTPKPSAWPPPSPWVTLAERAPHPQLGSTSPLRSSSAFHPCQGATPSPCPSAGLEPALGPVCRLWGTTVAELHDVPLLCHSFP